MRDVQDRNKRKTFVDHSLYGKVPPQAKDLEGAILGAIMLERDAIDRVAEFLKAECFYVDAHQRIFQAMMDIHGRNHRIDELVVTEELRRRGDLEMIGGPYYLAQLTKIVVGSANLEYHSRIILDKWTKRELIRIGGQLLSDSYEDTLDSQEVIGDLDKGLTSLLSSSSEKGLVPIDRAVITAIQRIMELRDNGEDMTGVPSGYRELDRITYGWQKTDLIILAARPSVGKTAFALNLARHAVLNSKKTVPVAFFSLEMSALQLTQRILSAESEIWLEKISRGKMDDYEMKQLYEKAVQKLSSAPLFIDDTPGLNIFELRAKCRRLKNKHNIGMIIIDYLQLMSGINGEKRNNNREQEISTISRNLKTLAKELEVPIIALSQLSRAPESRKGDDKSPKLSDLRESGAIEQDADMVMFLYRPEYYNVTENELGESTQGLTELSIAKHRSGKLALGREAIRLQADLSIQKFVTYEGGYEEPGARLSVDTGLGSNWKSVAELEARNNNDLPF